MAQQLRALVALPEDLDSIPSTHMAAHNSVTPDPGDLTPSHRHTHKQNTNAIKNKSLKKKKKTVASLPFKSLHPVWSQCLPSVCSPLTSLTGSPLLQAKGQPRTDCTLNTCSAPSWNNGQATAKVKYTTKESALGLCPSETSRSAGNADRQSRTIIPLGS